MSKFLTAKELKPGDLLVQYDAVSKGESKFVIVIRVSSDSIVHWHINKDVKNIERIRGNTCSIFSLRKPHKLELTEKVMKQYKTALLKLILKGII